MSTHAPRSQSRSPVRSPRQSPKRKALHERTDSESNVRSFQENGWSDSSSIYRKDPFPKLPSQLFIPHYGAFIQDGASSTLGGSALATPNSPSRRRNTRSFSSVSTDKENGPVSPSTPKRSSPFPTPSPRLRHTRSKSSRSGRNILPKLEPPEEWSRSDSNTPRLDDSLIPAPLTPARPKAESLATTESKLKSLLPDGALASCDAFVTAGSTPASPPLLRDGPLRSPGISPERPRSASTPISKTDALIQQILESGMEVQYPQLRQPSGTSLRTDATIARPINSRPLKLNRKRANSNLSKDVSGSLRDIYGPNGAKNPGTWPRRVKPGDSASSILSGDSAVDRETLPDAQLPLDAPRTSDGADEAADTIGELQPNTVRTQRSSNFSDRQPGSRPVSNDSKSSHGTFYNFLNNSATAWAKFYYRGESALSPATPPTVTQTQAPLSPVDLVSSAATSGPSQSPASIGFAQTIFIPRVRPRLRGQTLFHVSSNSSGSAPGFGPPLTRVAEERVVEHQQPMPHDGHYPTRALPRLSPDKRLSQSFPAWQTPSFDESQGIFGVVNRQIALFCIGFIFPFAWILGACLHIPVRPEIDRNTPSERFDNEKMAWDLFNSHELEVYHKARRWRFTNRVMAVFGGVILLFIIIYTIIATT